MVLGTHGVTVTDHAGRRRPVVIAPGRPRRRSSGGVTRFSAPTRATRRRAPAQRSARRRDRRVRGQIRPAWRDACLTQMRQVRSDRAPRGAGRTREPRASISSRRCSTGRCRQPRTRRFPRRRALCPCPCGYPKLGSRPLTCCYTANGSPAFSPGGAAADLPDVLDAPGLDRAAHPIRHQQGDRDPGPAPPARRPPTAHAGPQISWADRVLICRAHPIAARPPSPRPARHAGHDAPRPARHSGHDAMPPRYEGKPAGLVAHHLADATELNRDSV